MAAIRYIDDHPFSGKTVLLRVDLNLSFNPDHSIADDARLTQVLPTIRELLERQNKLIIVSHLGRPDGRDEKLTLKPVFELLKTKLPEQQFVFIKDFLTQKEHITQSLSENKIVFLENIRFYEGEEKNDPAFANELASLAQVFVNDAFSVSHRGAASIVNVTHLLPSFGGLLLKKEITALSHLTDNPKHPFVAIVGGGKISTKIHLLQKLTRIADHVLVGGGLANTLLLAEGKEVGNSLVEKDILPSLKSLVSLAEMNQTELVLPQDVLTGAKDSTNSVEKKVGDILPDNEILDIGPQTIQIFSQYIAQAQTVVWNGPLGYFENMVFAKGTDAIYQAIATNTDAFSVVGGGETLSAIKQKAHLDHISHISTAGGAMLEYIENGTLQGIEALKNAPMSI